MNVRLGNYVTTHTNDPQARIQLNQQLGMLSSALEHAIPEQMFTSPTNPGEAISAVKAIAKAQQQGQRIYHITQQNMNTALPNIHLDTNTMEEIRNALAIGKEVTTHTDPLSVPGYTGAGYIIIDPDTGIGAYKIGGGMNGAFIIILTFTFLILMAISVFAFAPFWLASIIALAGGVLSVSEFSKYIEDITTTKPIDEWNSSLAKESLFYGFIALITAKLAAFAGSGSHLDKELASFIRRIFNWIF